MWNSSAGVDVDGEIKRHGKAEGVEAWAEIGRGSGKPDVERPVLTEVRHAGCGRVDVRFKGAQDYISVGLEDDRRLAQRSMTRLSEGRARPLGGGEQLVRGGSRWCTASL